MPDPCRRRLGEEKNEVINAGGHESTWRFNHKYHYIYNYGVIIGNIFTGKD